MKTFRVAFVTRALVTFQTSMRLGFVEQIGSIWQRLVILVFRVAIFIGNIIRVRQLEMPKLKLLARVSEGKIRI